MPNFRDVGFLSIQINGDQTLTLSVHAGADRRGEPLAAHKVPAESIDWEIDSELPLLDRGAGGRVQLDGTQDSDRFVRVHRS